MFSSLKVECVTKIDVRLPDDTKSPRITGCVFMPDGLSVICDNLNQKVKTLSKIFVLRENVDLNAQPWDLAVCNNSKVIVSLPRSKQLQFLQVVPKLELGNVIQLDKMCWGVEVVAGEIYITCHNDRGEGEVRILDMDGTLQKKVGFQQDGSFMFTRPHYLTVNASSNKVFVSDINISSVTCLKLDGSLLYEYMDQNLKCPRGICVDEEDNVIVCSESTHNVQVVQPNGKRYGTLVTLKDGIYGPLCMTYRQCDKMLFISCYYKSVVFKLQ